jgi:hypothetical protein
MSLDEAIMFADDSETKRRLTAALQSGQTDRTGQHKSSSSGGRSSRSRQQNPELMYRAKGLLRQEMERRTDISAVRYINSHLSPRCLLCIMCCLTYALLEPSVLHHGSHGAHD